MNDDTESAGDIPVLDMAGDVATITLRRPQQGNRLNGTDLEVLAGLIDEVNQTAARVLVLRALGKHFCTGFDLNTVGVKRKGPSFGVVVDDLEHCRPITIAAIQGGVLGGATDLALACDFRIGATPAFMYMPAARLGLHFHLAGMRRYVSRLGLNQAKRLFLTAAQIESQAMLDIGFLTALVPQADFDGAVIGQAQVCASMAPLAASHMKRHLNAIAGGCVDEARFERDMQACAASSDLQEGLAAWREKRQPLFIGR